MLTDLTRRDLLQLGLAGGACAAVAGCRGQQSPGVRAASNRVRAAVIGAGRRGCTHVRLLNRIASGWCAAIADPNEINLRKAASVSAHGPEAVSEYRRVLERNDIEAVLVATPIHTHFAIVRDAIQSGKHVFCETTLVLRYEEMAALRALAHEHATQVLQTGFQRRYSQFYQTARMMAAKGFLGQVTRIDAQWHVNPGWTAPGAGEPRERAWQLFRDYSHGLTGGITAHQIDLAEWLFDEQPESVIGAGGLDWHKDGRDTYDNITLTFKYPGGPQLTCTAMSTSKHLGMLGGTRDESGEIILGTDGAIEITVGTESAPGGAMWFVEPGPRISSPDGQPEKPAFAGASIPKTGRVAWPLLLPKDEIRSTDPFLQREAKHLRRWLYSRGVMVPEEEVSPGEAQLTAFLRCCRGEERTKAGVEEGLSNAASVMLANLAMDEGRRLKPADLDERAEKGTRG